MPILFKLVTFFYKVGLVYTTRKGILIFYSLAVIVLTATLVTLDLTNIKPLSVRGMIVLLTTVSGMGSICSIGLKNERAGAFSWLLYIIVACASLFISNMTVLFFMGVVLISTLHLINMFIEKPPLTTL